MPETTQIDREILEKVHNLDKILTRFESHFTSEIGLLRSEYEQIRERIERVHDVVYGKDGDGFNIRLDRLEQSEKSRKNQQKLMWGGVATALAPYIQKLIALLA